MFVIIVKRVKDLKDKSQFKGLPLDYPVDLREVIDHSEVDAVLAQHPDAEVLTKEQWQGMRLALDMIYEHAKQSKPGFFSRLFGG